MTALIGMDEFLAHYQLTHDPFAVRTPGFRFFTPKRKPVLAELHHLARYGKQLLCVVAPEGGGKTLLRQALVASSNKDSVQALVASGKECATTDALISFFCHGAGAESHDASALMLRSEQLAATGMQLYLVVDDAELLSADTLQMLADLRAAGEQAPRIFLFADDSIRWQLEALDNSEMPDALPAAHITELLPLDAAEVRDYLHQRLEAAGQGIELLDEKQLASIVEVSGGWPGRINQAAREQMLAAIAPVAPRHQRSASKPVIPVKSLLALLLVGVGVVLAWFMGGGEREPETTVLQLPPPAQVVPADVDEAAEPVLQAQAPAEPDEEVTAASEPVAPLPDPVEPVATDPVPAVEGSGTEDVAEATVTERSWQPLPLTSPEREALNEPAEPAQAELEPRPEPAEVAEPAAAASESAATPAATTTGSVHGADWYRERAASEYVLQLLGSRSESSARAFVREHAELADLGLFETTHQGQPWFVVTQGIYPDSRAAARGVANLPAALRQQQPWPRRIEGIQQGLR